MTESILQQQTKNHLDSLRYCSYKIFNKEGWPDIIGCYCGYFFGLELKSEKGKVRKLQNYELEKLRKSGAMICIPRNLETVKSFMEMLKQMKSL